MPNLSRKELNKFYNSLLKPFDFKDYGPNGLQVEGSEEIKHICFALSATRASIEKAVELSADTLIVHHGLFWGFHGPKTITGPFAKRVKPLVLNNINLFGYHLPLDANLECGNAKTIADAIGLSSIEPFGDYKGCPTGVKGQISPAIKPNLLKDKLEQTLSHSIIHTGSINNQDITSIGIITGGANSDWALAAKQGLDAYITGEISEHDWHESKEAGVHMFAGGHNATESLGIISLMKKTQQHFNQYTDLNFTFIDSENPA